MDNEECSCGDALPREEFEQFKKDYNNMVARLAREESVNERILAMQNAVKDCEKVNSTQASRMNSFANEIKGIADMVQKQYEYVTATFELFTKMIESQPVVTTKKVIDNTQKPSTRTPVKGKSFPEFNEKFIEKITGTLKADVVVKEVETRRGPQTTTKLWLTDGKSDVNITLWGDGWSEVEDYRKDDEITLTNLSLGKPYKDTPQLSSTTKTEVL